MRRYIRYCLCLLSCVIGGTLIVVFLIDNRWMKEPNHYDSETGMVLHSFNIGFHWTTLIGMMGVILLILGIQHLLKAEKYILGMVALTVFVINLCSWDFFLSISEIYYTIVLKYDERIMLVYYIMKLISIMSAVFLLVVMFWKFKKKRVGLCDRIMATLVLIPSTSCLAFKTICNQWYLLQIVLIVAAVSAAGGGKLACFYLKKKKRRKGWTVL